MLELVVLTETKLVVLSVVFYVTSIFCLSAMCLAIFDNAKLLAVSLAFFSGLSMLIGTWCMVMLALYLVDDEIRRATLWNTPITPRR